MSPSPSGKLTQFRSSEARDAAGLELFTRLDHTEDPREQHDLRAAIAIAYVDLAEALARRFRGRGESFEDLRQAAYVGLMKAIRGYTLDRGSPFVAYAVPTITGELKRHFRDHCWAIRPSRRVQELHAELGAMTEALAQELGHEPSPRELTARLGDDRLVVDQARSAHNCYTPRSLDATVGSDESTPLHTGIGEVDPGYERAETHVVLADLIQALPERDRELLGLRFYADLTQREIAERIGVTQMQVSRLLASIFARLREGLLGHGADVSDDTEREPAARVEEPLSA
jgi:RNA polymerase sigma-B factor